MDGLNKTIKRIKLNSNNVSFGLLPRPGLEIEQHITICSDGRVYFSSYSFTEDLNYESVKQSRKKQFKLDPMDATYLVNMIGIYFRDNIIDWFATDIGTWDLEIENDSGEKFEYHGSLCAELLVDGKDLSVLIRKYLAMPELFCFDDAYRVPIEKKPDEYIFVNISFYGNNKTYCYICDDDLIHEEDEVLVPIGNDGDSKVGFVESMEVCSADNAPYPVDKCKKVISRIEK